MEHLTVEMMVFQLVVEMVDSLAVEKVEMRVVQMVADLAAK